MKRLLVTFALAISPLLASAEWVERDFITSTLWITTNGTSTLTLPAKAPYIEVQPGTPVLVQLSMVATNASTAAVQVTWQGSVDGVSWSTYNNPPTFGVPLNGTTAVVALTNYPWNTTSTTTTIVTNGIAVTNDIAMASTSLLIPPNYSYRFLRPKTIVSAHNVWITVTDLKAAYYKP